MAQIPASVLGNPLIEGSSTTVDQFMIQNGLPFIHEGKTRRTYRNPDKPHQRILVATDRLSVFDFVLPVLVPDKGKILTALTHFWLTFVLSKWNHHLVPSTTMPRFNAAFDYKRRFGKRFPVERTLVVQEHAVLPFELIFRYHLGGSVWKTYEQTGTAGGHVLRTGLKRWHKLEEPIFTPSTKAQEGHDINITAAEFFEYTPDATQTVQRCIEAYKLVYKHAHDRGVRILDTKLECADALHPVLLDEVFTPDSSRFTTDEDYQLAFKQGRDPIFFDKEEVRIWGRTIETPWGTGIHTLDPLNPEHVAFVHSLTIPEEVVAKTSSRYHEIFQLLTGEYLEDYQEMAMGVACY